MKKFGKADGGLLVLCLLIILAAFLGSRGGEPARLQAEITLEGAPCRQIELTGHRGRELIELDTPKGRNLILVEDESICVLEADCPDKICVKAGKLSKAGETAACLPHKLLIEIKESPSP